MQNTIVSTKLLPYANFDCEETAVRIYPADLGHIESAILALRSKHQYTSAERVTEIRKIIYAMLIDS